MPKRWHIKRPIKEIQKETGTEACEDGKPQKKARIKKPNKKPPVGPNKKAREAPNPAKTGIPIAPSIR